MPTPGNARATLVPLYSGLRARGQNAWPNVRFDLFALMEPLSGFCPLFYYKTFMWPNWHTWEWLVRRIAGLGTAPEGPDPQTYIKQNVHADLVVIGAGRSGLQAALEAAADAECRVLLIDEQEEPGGALLASPSEADIQWLRDTLERIAAQKNITLLSRTTVNGYYDNNVLAALERVTNHLGPLTDDQPRERFWRIFAGRVVLATGALERPMVFPNNDRPGIMLASALAQYTHRYGLTLADRIVFYSNNDTAWRSALALVDAGVAVTAIVDIRTSVDEDLVQRAELAGIELHLGTAVTDTRGRAGLRRVMLQSIARR